jgi:hypothetical protein
MLPLIRIHLKILNLLKAIYDAYSNIKPLLIRIKTGEKTSWGNLFSKRFEGLDSMHRDILVGLIEGGGYKFAD